jgi:hypothetical protein
MSARKMNANAMLTNHLRYLGRKGGRLVLQIIRISGVLIQNWGSAQRHNTFVPEDVAHWEDE